MTVNKEEAFKYYLRAAQQNDAEAQFKIGNCYEKGEGVSHNLVQSMKYFNLAARQGHSEALIEVGQHISIIKEEPLDMSEKRVRYSY